MKDTDEYYEEIRKAYPESSQDMGSRIKYIAQYYLNQHANRKDKSRFYIIATHREVMASLPDELNCKINQMFDYCGSFEIAIKGNEEPVGVKVNQNTDSYVHKIPNS